MARKPKTTTNDPGVDAAQILEKEFIRQMMDLYRADNPASNESDGALYERMRQKLLTAFPRLEFDSLENLPTSRALGLVLGGKLERAGALLKEHHAQQNLVKQGQIHGKRSKAGNDAQAMARLAALPEGHLLKQARDVPERNRIICDRAAQLRREHPNLRPADINLRVANWAQMSQKQIGRILKGAGD